MTSIQSIDVDRVQNGFIVRVGYFGGMIRDDAAIYCFETIEKLTAWIAEYFSSPVKEEKRDD